MRAACVLLVVWAILAFTLPWGRPTIAGLIGYTVALGLAEFFATFYRLETTHWGVSFTSGVFALALAAEPGMWLTISIVPIVLAKLGRGSRGLTLFLYSTFKALSLVFGLWVALQSAAMLADLSVSPSRAQVAGAALGAAAAIAAATALHSWGSGARTPLRTALAWRGAAREVLNINIGIGYACLWEANPALVGLLILPTVAIGVGYEVLAEHAIRFDMFDRIAAGHKQARALSVLDTAQALLYAIHALAPHAHFTEVAVLGSRQSLYRAVRGESRLIQTGLGVLDQPWVSRMRTAQNRLTVVDHGETQETWFRIGDTPGPVLVFRAVRDPSTRSRRRHVYHMVHAMAQAAPSWLPDSTGEVDRMSTPIAASCARMKSLAAMSGPPPVAELLRELTILQELVAAHLSGTTEPGIATPAPRLEGETIVSGEWTYD